MTIGALRPLAHRGFPEGAGLVAQNHMVMSLERFRAGRLLVGNCGHGAVS